MHRWELVTSDEYLKVYADNIIRSDMKVSKMRSDLYDFLLKYRDEILHGPQDASGCGDANCKVCYPHFNPQTK